MMEIQNNESRRLLDAEYGEEETGVRSEQDEYLDKVKNGKLYLATFAAVLGPLSFGFVLGYSSPAIPELSTITDQRLQLDKEEASWFGSIVTIGAAIGGLLGGWMVDRIGRKLSLMFCSIPYIFGFTIIIAAQNVWMLYLGRVLTGLASGVTSLVVPLYISEMAHERVRGAMGSCVQLMVVTGIMGVYIAVTRSSRFMLYNICRVGPYLTQEVAQVLVQALVISHLDYCNSLLAGCHQTPAIYPERCSLPGVQPSHVTPLLHMLHWLPVEAHIHYKTMVLDYGAARGTAPPYLQAILNPYTPTRALRFSTSGLMALPSLWEGSSHSAQSKVFSVLVPQCWNQLPPEARTAESLPIFPKTSETLPLQRVS